MLAITPELAIKIVFDVIAVVTGFYGVVHVVFYKLNLPGFERWAFNLGATLLAISAVLFAIGLIF